MTAPFHVATDGYVRLAADLLDVRGGCLTLTMRRPTHVRLEAGRAIAAQLRGALSTVEASLHEDPLGSDGLAAVHDRWCQPSSELCILDIRSHADTPAGAQRLAHSLAARIGSGSGFETLAAHRGADGAAREAAKRRALADRVRAAGVLADPAELDYIAALPSLFTMSEATNVLSLPYATRSGLPGIASRPVPPFAAATAVPDGEPREDCIELGHVQERLGRAIEYPAPVASTPISAHALLQ